MDLAENNVDHILGGNKYQKIVGTMIRYTGSVLRHLLLSPKGRAVLLLSFLVPSSDPRQNKMNLSLNYISPCKGG